MFQQTATMGRFIEGPHRIPNLRRISFGAECDVPPKNIRSSVSLHLVRCFLFSEHTPADRAGVSVLPYLLNQHSAAVRYFSDGVWLLGQMSAEGLKAEPLYLAECCVSSGFRIGVWRLNHQGRRSCRGEESEQGRPVTNRRMPGITHSGRSANLRAPLSVGGEQRDSLAARRSRCLPGTPVAARFRRLRQQLTSRDDGPG